MATSRKIALLFGVENINAIVGWTALLFVARNMGASALGEFSYAMSLIGGFTFLAFFGFRMAHVKRISEGLDLGKCIGTFLSIRLALISLMLAVFSIFYWYWTDYLEKEFYDIKTEGLLFVVVIYYIVYLLTGVLTSTFSGLKQSARVAIPRIIGTSIRSFLLIGTALMGWGVLWLATSELIGILIIALISLWYFRDYPISKPDKSTFDSYKSYAFPVAAASIFGIFKKHIDKIFIGVFWAATDVGLYFGVQRIALFIGTMALAIEEMLLPSVSKLHSNKSNNEIRSLVYDAEKYVAMVCIPIVVMIIVWSNEIIFVFISREFLPATRILQILVLASLVRVINRPWSVALRGSNRPDLTSSINIFSSIISVILMLILVPREIPHLGLDNLPGLGGEGAAIAVLISELILAISLRILCYSYLEMRPQISFFVQILFAIIVGLIMWQIQLNLDIDRWYELFFFSALGGFLYISFLAAAGTFTLQDFNFFWNAMNPKAMGSYVSEELKRK